MTTTIKEAAVNVDKELIERGNTDVQTYVFKNDLDIFLESYSKGEADQEESEEAKNKKKEFTFKIDDDEDGGQIISVASEQFHDPEQEEKKASEEEAAVLTQQKEIIEEIKRNEKPPDEEATEEEIKQQEEIEKSPNPVKEMDKGALIDLEDYVVVSCRKEPKTRTYLKQLVPWSEERFLTINNGSLYIFKKVPKPSTAVKNIQLFFAKQ